MVSRAGGGLLGRMVLAWVMVLTAVLGLVGCGRPVVAEPVRVERERLPAPPVPVRGAFVGTVGEAVVVAGGVDADGAASDRVVWIPAGARSWRVAEARLPAVAGGGATVALADGLVCIGGEARGVGQTSVSLLQVIGGSVRVSVWPPLPEPRIGATAWLDGSSIVVLGGRASARGESVAGGWVLAWDGQRQPTEWRRLGVESSVGASLDGRVLAVAPHPVGAGQWLLGGSSNPEGELGARLLRVEGGEITATNLGPALEQSVPTAEPSWSRGVPVRLGQYHLAMPWFGAPQDVALFDALGHRFSRRPLVGLDGAGERFPAGLTHWLPWPGANGSSALVLAAEPSRAERWTLHEAERSTTLLDGLVLGGYLLLVLGLGARFWRRKRSADAFFLADRKIPWWAAGLSILATQVSAITFVAIPGVAYRYDCTRWLGHWTILMVAPLVVRFYLPKFRAAGVRSAYDLLEQRFGLALRWFGSAAFVAFHLGRIGIVLYLPALALHAVTGIDVFVAIAWIGGLSTLYTVVGGIEAVIWTDVIQAIVLLVGAVACLVVAVSGAGGVDSWWATAGAAGRTDLFDWRFDPTATVVWVVVLGNLTASLTTYTTDQTVVQRYLSARSDAEAVRAVVLNAVMMVAVGGLFFWLGTALFGFYSAHPEALTPGRSDAVLPGFIATQLPAFVRAIVLAALLAAAMSSLDSSINGVASTVVHDWFERLRPTLSSAQSLRIGRVVSVLVGLSGIGFGSWIAAAQVAAMFDWFNMLLGLVGSGLAAAFALAVFSRRTTGPGVLVGVVVALGVTLWVRAATPLHLYLYGAIGFATCVVVALLASPLFPGRLSTRTP